MQLKTAQSINYDPLGRWPLHSWLSTMNSKKISRSNPIYSQLCCCIINPTIFNIIRWVDGTIVSLTKRLMFQVHIIFFFIISCNFFCKNPFNLFFYNFKKIKTKSFECPKSKPATHCFIFNLSK